MRHTLRISLLVVAAILLVEVTALQGQVSGDMESRHRAGAGFGFTFIPLAGELGETDARGLFVPSLRMEYSIDLKKNWALIQ